MQLKTLDLAAACALALALPAGAHHSHGNYDISKWTSNGDMARGHGIEREWD